MTNIYEDVDFNPPYIDMTAGSLRYILKFFETPCPGEIEDLQDDQYVRLYRNGEYEILTP